MSNKKIFGAVLFTVFFTACANVSASSLESSSLMLSSMTMPHDHSSLKQTGPGAQQTHPDSWNQLIWSAKNNVLKVTNTGLSALSLNPEIKLMPDKMPGTLEKSYILPGETLIVYGVCKHHLPTQTTVVIEALAEDGTKQGSKTMPVTR